MIRIMIAIVLSLIFCTSSASAASMVGTWKSSDPHMVAHISDGVIQIEWVTSSGRALYWLGSMPKRMKPGSRTVSIGRKSVMDYSLLASSETHKGFAYRGGKLVFSLSAFGVTTTVRMHRR